MSNPNINRAQLAKFLPSPQAIKAFEDLFKAVADGLPSNLEDVEVTAGLAQQQAGEALAGLAVVAHQLAMLLLAPSSEQQVQDQYAPPNEPWLLGDSYGPGVDFSNLLDFYTPPSQPSPDGLANPASVNITGGIISGTTIENSTIGATNAASGRFTSLNVVGNSILGSSVTNSTTINGTASGISNTGARWMILYKTTGLSNDSGIWQDAAGNTELALRNSSGVVGASLKSSGNSSLPGNLDISGALTVNSSTLIRSTTTLSNGAGAAAGTLANAPVVGNPTKWIPINDNGTTRYIPAW